MIFFILKLNIVFKGKKNLSSYLRYLIKIKSISIINLIIESI